MAEVAYGVGVPALLSRLDKQIGYRQGLIEQKAELMMKLDQANTRIEHVEPMKLILQRLSERVTAESSGLYSELLTAIVRDVFDDQDQSVQVDAKMKGDHPELVINTIKHGHEEDVVKSRGGSINNVLSVGIRFISLISSSNRRFVILDEADCWLKDSLVERFAAVLGKFCAQAGVQCLYVSHQSPELFSPYGSVVELYQSEGRVQCRVKEDGKLFSQEEKRFGADLIDNRLRYVAVHNVTNFADIKIPLSPGLTVLAGPNDVGKSALFSAMEALFNGQAAPHLIRHDETAATVTVGIEDELDLTFGMSNGRGAKPVYTLRDIGGAIIKTEEYASKDAEQPAWVSKLLSMPWVNGVNIHVGQQRDPLFLLNPAYTPKKRAELFNLGEAYYQFHDLTGRFVADQKDAKNQKKQLMSDLDSCNQKLEKTRWVEMLYDVANELRTITGQIDLTRQQIDVLKKLAEPLSYQLPISTDVFNALKLRQDHIVNAMNEHAHLIQSGKDTLASLSQVSTSEIALESARSAIQRMPRASQAAERMNEAITLLATLKQGAVAGDLLDVLAMHRAVQQASQVDDLRTMVAASTELNDSVLRMRSLQDQQRQTLEESNHINNKIDDIYTANDGYCPVCQSSVKVPF